MEAAAAKRRSAWRGCGHLHQGIPADDAGPPTFAMAVGVPILQLVLFGYAINTDPKGLPTALVSTDAGRRAQPAGHAPEHRLFPRHPPARQRGRGRTPDRGRRGAVPDRGRRFLAPRGARRAAGGADQRGRHRPQRGQQRPGRGARSAHALAATCGPLRPLQPGEAPFELRIQRRYNPEGLSRYNIVPGLIGTILTMTMVMLTGLAMTRERERGTMENLLATPVRPVEVMVGKILPYVVVGYIQLA
jgi:ABC-2 type transport system permease protein